MSSFADPQHHDDAAPRRVSDGTLADRVYGVFIQRILTGAFRQGQRLPTEHELASAFGVSRPVLRQAMERLKAEGLVRSRQGSGSIIAAVPDRAAIGIVRGGSVAEVQRCFEFRCALEPEAAAHAALRRSEADLERIAAALALLDEATRHHLHREDADFTFHLAIAAATGNGYFHGALNGLKDDIAAGMKLHGLSVSGPRPALEEVYAEHRAIFAAIAAGDAPGAREAMAAHLISSHDRLFAGTTISLRRA